MQRHVRPLRYGQENQTRRPPTHSPQRLSPGRRATRPLLLDSAAQHNSNLPVLSLLRTANRDLRLPTNIRQVVPVLGVRGGFPGLDEGQHATG